jgi:hypothetical protein
MPENYLHYQSYLLRLRYLDNGGQPVWRFSLEGPGGAPEPFTTLEDVMAFLRALTADIDRLAADRAKPLRHGLLPETNHPHTDCPASREHG